MFVGDRCRRSWDVQGQARGPRAEGSDFVGGAVDVAERRELPSCTGEGGGVGGNGVLIHNPTTHLLPRRLLTYVPEVDLAEHSRETVRGRWAFPRTTAYIEAVTSSTVGLWLIRSRHTGVSLSLALPSLGEDDSAKVWGWCSSEGQADNKQP